MNSKRMDKEMDWSLTMSNVENMSLAFVPPPWMESNSSNSLFDYDHPYAGNLYTPANTQTGPIITVPESEKMINAYQSLDNNSDATTKKKIRLTNEQLDSLEQSFQEDMKLDSNRKAELSKKLGLSQRQVAVWFQNRHSRWKVKDLEESYDSLRHVHEIVLRENHMLHDEVKMLRGIILKDHLMMSETNVNNNNIAGIDQYNNSTVVSPYCWLPISQPPYPW